MSVEVKRERLIAVKIDRGIIALIEPNGEIGYYRQRGINQLSSSEIAKCISLGKLNPRWKEFKELPHNYSIGFEDEAVMGRAYASFNPNRKVV